jgi:hypothetical protein
MTEEEYYAAEITDSQIQAQADNGEFYLERSGFDFRPSQAEIRTLVNEGEQLCHNPLEHQLGSPKIGKLTAASLSLLTLAFFALAWVTR